jgi:redox-sensitive bicupin YhaK (pirin superfamily)
MEGAGVKLRRAFGFGDTSEFDPFLLFDDFRNDRPADYMAGFPWHPHRGIETITYVLPAPWSTPTASATRRLAAGDIQWMTGGRGILHQEMPQATNRPRTAFSSGRTTRGAEDDRSALPGHPLKTLPKSPMTTARRFA